MAFKQKDQPRHRSNRAQKEPQNNLMASQLQAAFDKKKVETKEQKDVFQKKAREIRKAIEKKYPKIFDRENYIPLKVGIHKDLIEDNPDLFDPPQHLKYFIKNHVSQVGYAYAILNSTHRVDLKGENVSEIKEEEKKHSKKICREYHERRRVQFLEKIMQQLPKCFFKNFRQRAPISVKVIEQLQEKYPKESLVLIKKVIEYYKSNYSYHENIAMEKFTHFIGINGENLDEITKEQREEASKVAKDLRERINKKK